MAKGISKIASKYARALLYNVEKEFGTSIGASGKAPAQEVGANLESLATAFTTNRDLNNALLSPMFSEPQRLGALQAVADAAGLPEIVKKFLTLVFQRGRLTVLGEIAAAFMELADKAASVVTVEVVTARPISPDEQQEISNSLAKVINGRLEFEWQTDPRILGGMLVRYSGNVLDGTLRSRLHGVEQSLMQ